MGLAVQLNFQPKSTHSVKEGWAEPAMLGSWGKGQYLCSSCLITYRLPSMTSANPGRPHHSLAAVSQVLLTAFQGTAGEATKTGLDNSAMPCNTCGVAQSISPHR